MHGWVELSAYRPLVALLCGSATAGSFWGIGRLLCGRALARAADFIRVPAECVAGVIVLGMLVEIVAMGNASQISVMRGAWILAVIAGAIAAIQSAWHRGGDDPPAMPDSVSPAHSVAATMSSGSRLIIIGYWLPAALLSAALLLAGAAPESRSDEVAYHTLVSVRPLVDGGLRFYPLPWEASVIPQMLWHYALTPLYAISGAAAGGVASAWLAILLGFAVGRLVQGLTHSPLLGATAAFITLSGGYSIVFFTTAGPHAFGYLSVFVAVTAIGWSAEIRAAVGLRSHALIIALGCAGAVATKLTMLPVAAIISGFALWDIARAGSASLGQSAGSAGGGSTSLGPSAGSARGGSTSLSSTLGSVAFIVLIPSVCLMVPIAWTWSVAGSPLGALTARVFHAASFDSEALSAYEGTRALFSNNFGWRFEAAYWSLPLLAAILLSLWLEPSRQRRLRWIAIAGCQALLLIFALPHELRHFGGIQYPLMASGFAAIASRAQARGYSTGRIALVGGVAALPWALFALWLVTIYVPLSTGQLSPAEFLRQYSGLQSDYEALDKVLPRDATLLIGRSHSDLTQYAWYSRPPVYYAPRPVLFGTSQVHGQPHLYLFYLGTGAQGTQGPIPFDPWLPEGYSLGRCVYSDAQARFYPSRTPGGTPGLARLDVFELVRR